MFKNYQDANEYLGKKNDRPYQTTPKNNRVQRDSDGNISIVYYGTPVVTYLKDEDVLILNSEDKRRHKYRTSMTKKRINEALQAAQCGSIWQDDGIWYYHNGSTSVVFRDGMSILCAGSWSRGYHLEIREEEELERIQKAKDKIKHILQSTRSLVQRGTLYESDNSLYYTLLSKYVTHCQNRLVEHSNIELKELTGILSGRSYGRLINTTGWNRYRNWLKDYYGVAR